MQTLKELLAEIEDLRSQLAAQDKKPRVPPRTPPAPTAPKPAADAPATPAPQPAPKPMKLETWSPGKKPAADTATPPVQPGDNAPTPVTTDAPKQQPEATAAPTPVSKVPAKPKADPAAKEKARARLKEISTTATWRSARYAAVSALEEQVTDADFDAWLAVVKQQLCTPATLADGLDDARELVKAIRNKTAWKEEKAMPEDRKAHVRKAEQMLVGLIDAGDAAISGKIAEMLYENGTRGEIRVPAGKKLGLADCDIFFREWTVKGRKLEPAQLECIYKDSKDWRQKWQAGKELGLKQAATEVYANTNAEREDRFEASKMLGISACDFALHERQLGKELKKEDLKQIWIHAKDLDVRNAAAEELGHSSAKIWMAEHPHVIVGAGVIFLVIVGISVIWRPWRYLRRHKAPVAVSQQVEPATNAPVAAAGNGAASSPKSSAGDGDATAPAEKPGTSTTAAGPSPKGSTGSSTGAQPPDDTAGKVNMADIMSSGSSSSKLDPSVAPPDLPDIPDDKPEDSPGIIDKPAPAKPAEVVTPPAIVPVPVTAPAPKPEPPAVVPVATSSNAIVQPAPAVPPKAVTPAAPAVIRTNATSPAQPAVITPRPVSVVKTTNVVRTVTNKVVVTTTVPPKASGSQVVTGKVIKAVTPVVAATNVPRAVATVKSTNVVLVSTNKVLPKATVPATPQPTSAVTGKVMKAVTPGPVTTTTNRPTVSVRSTNVVRIVTNRIDGKTTVPSAVTNSTNKVVAPPAVRPLAAEAVPQ